MVKISNPLIADSLPKKLFCYITQRLEDIMKDSYMEAPYLWISKFSSNAKVKIIRRRKITKAFTITASMSMSDQSSANGESKKRSQKHKCKTSEEPQRQRANMILNSNMILLTLIVLPNPLVKSELQNPSYVLYDRVMEPLSSSQERKPRRDRGTRKGRTSTSSTPAFGEPSSSHPTNDDEDVDHNEVTLVWAPACMDDFFSILSS
ncbi:hypothetical protein Tco_0364490 [Tanacetum coccineum]